MRYISNGFKVYFSFSGCSKIFPQRIHRPRLFQSLLNICNIYLYGTTKIIIYVKYNSTHNCMIEYIKLVIKFDYNLLFVYSKIQDLYFFDILTLYQSGLVWWMSFVNDKGWLSWHLSELRLSKEISSPESNGYDVSVSIKCTVYWKH